MHGVRVYVCAVMLSDDWCVGLLQKSRKSRKSRKCGGPSSEQQLSQDSPLRYSGGREEWKEGLR